MQVAHSIALIRMEEETGKRFCISCDAFIDKEKFFPGQRRYKCRFHFKQARKEIVKSTPTKRAINTLRSKAHQDMRRFNQPKMIMGVSDITTLLTPEQLEDFSNVAIMPRDPAEPLSLKNAAVISTVHRSSIMALWKGHRNAAEYKRTIDDILDFADGVKK